MPLHHTTTPAHREPGSPEPVVQEEPSGFVSEPGFFNHPEPTCEPDHPAGGALSRLQDVLRRDTVAGILLVVAAVIALVWANSPAADSYFQLRDRLSESRPGCATQKRPATLAGWCAGKSGRR